MADPSPGPTKLLLVCVDETDRCGEDRLYAAVVRLLYQHGVAGATVLQGIMGYGVHRHIHRRTMFGMGDDEPVMIVAVDSEQKLEAVIPEVRRLVKEGLVVLVDAQAIPHAAT